MNLIRFKCMSTTFTCYAQNCCNKKCLRSNFKSPLTFTTNKVILYQRLQPRITNDFITNRIIVIIIITKKIFIVAIIITSFFLLYRLGWLFQWICWVYRRYSLFLGWHSPLLRGLSCSPLSRSDEIFFSRLQYYRKKFWFHFIPSITYTRKLI